MKSSKVSRLKRIYEVYRPLHKALRNAILLDSVSQAMALIVPFLYGKIVDGIINGRSFSDQMWIVTGVFISMELRGWIYWLNDKQYLKSIAFDNEEIASDTTLSGVTKLSVGQIVNQNSGFKHDVIKKGETAIAETVYTLLTQVISAVLRVFIAAIALCFISWVMGVITMLSIVMFVVVSFHINSVMLPDMKKHNKLSNKLGTSYWERIKNLRLVMVNSQEDRMKEEFATQQEHCNSIGRNLWVGYVRKIHLLREQFSHLGQVGVILVGVYMTSTGTATAGSIVIALGWSMHAFGALSMIGSVQRQLARNSVIIGRYFDLLDILPAVRMAENPIRPKDFVGDIEFQNVSFNYPKFEPTKEDDDEDEKGVTVPAEESIGVGNLSFTIKAGTMCAFVGPSGSGKSTAVALLLRYYDPIKGKVLVDGHDLTALDICQWRKAVGTVEQDPKLWDETVGYNLAYGINGKSTSVTQVDLERVSKIARIDEFYPRLGSKRFDTLIGENGVQLSGGQRQRIAIGRALMKNPCLMILDEATNALDPENEALVHQAMRQAMQGRTSIVIAHRLSTIRHADKIIVFKAGGIAGMGNHAELMSSCKEYEELVTRELNMLMG